MLHQKVALITGGAKRVGACIAKKLHGQGIQIIVHYNHSHQEASQLCAELNQLRPHSAVCIQANLKNIDNIPQLVGLATATWGRLDILINNAASFKKESISNITSESWKDTLSSNLKAPVFLALEAASHLRKTKGCIINMVDIRATRPLKHYTSYCISKAGLVMATKSLAIEWAPDIRVNAIAPGVVLWPDEINESEQKQQEKIIARTPLQRTGVPEDIAKTALFLIEHAPYVTGQVINVDGGRSLV